MTTVPEVQYWTKDGKYVEMTAEERLLFSKIYPILSSRVREMEGYSYYGSNPGVPEDSLEDIVGDLMQQFDITEKASG